MGKLIQMMFDGRGRAVESICIHGPPLLLALRYHRTLLLIALLRFVLVRAAVDAAYVVEAFQFQ